MSVGRRTDLRTRGGPRGASVPRVVAAAVSFLLAGWLLVGCGSPTVTITIRYSAFDPAEVHVPSGVPVTFVLVNTDPIDHEWIIGDPALHRRHRTGTEPAHGERPTEITVPARSTRRTTVTFDAPGELAFICHLPLHESYGMVGRVVVS